MPGRGLQESHLCAVVSRTGRACGGRRPAHFCWANKKAQTSEGEVAAPVLPEPSISPQPVPDFPSSSSSESVVPLPKRRSSAQGEAPVTPPKAAPVKSAPATPKLVPQPKTKKAAGKAAPEPKQPPAAKSSRSSRAALEVTELGFVVERPASIPADEDFKMTTMPATLNPPMEEVIWDRLATV